MSNAGIGRLLVASLHQAIADELPGRLEFYENWLHPEGLRHGTIGLAPLTAVLSFLRQEGPAYHAIMGRAGTYAAEWMLAGSRVPSHALVRALPAGLRMRLALGAARRLVRRCNRDSRAAVRVRRDAVTVVIRGSVFCAVREPVPLPLCGFYAAAITRALGAYGVAGGARASGCRAVGAPACVMSVEAPGRDRSGADAATQRSGEGETG
jgi:hypothetical protein